jgi:sec-independent protein translocase protein TatC
VELKARDLVQELHTAYPESFAAPKADDERKIKLTLWAEEFAQFKKAHDLTTQPITLTVQEAFLTYVKVSVVGGLVLSAPCLFYHIWMFVAAGLYPHEKKYVYVFLPISIFLFVAGALFCFFVVFPVMLDYLLGFNEWLKTVPQIRLSEWISFAIILPVMFGVSFQLPLVMLFLERISVFEVKTYQNQRRIAILVIAFVSMILTPSPDPFSMVAMMIPLCLLYELGIVMCKFMENKKPFEPETV